jgi:hypothetical protein
VKQDGYALRYVKEQSEAICIEAVKQNGDALQYVKEECLKIQYVEMTMGEICNKLNCNVKIIK